jgi:hypothetical protein
MDVSTNVINIDTIQEENIKVCKNVLGFETI